jgi:hypothetical protein
LIWQQREIPCADEQKLLLETWDALAPGFRWSEFAADGRAYHIPVIAGEYSIALGNKVIRGTRCKRLDSESGICRALGGKDAAVTDKQVGDVMRAAELVYNGAA